MIHVYDFQVHLMINDEYLKNLQTIRIMADNYKEAEVKLTNHFENKDNVKLVEYYFITDYNVIV